MWLTTLKKIFKKSLNTNKKGDLLGLSLDITVVIIDIALIAIRMFNKSAAEAFTSITNFIFGNFCTACDKVGASASNIPFLGAILKTFFGGFSYLSNKIADIVNFIPNTFYNFWEIMFWVFIIMTLINVLPVILAKYNIEKKYIRERAMKSKEPDIIIDTTKDTQVIKHSETLSLENNNQNSIELLSATRMNSFDKGQ